VEINNLNTDLRTISRAIPLSITSFYAKAFRTGQRDAAGDDLYPHDTDYILTWRSRSW